MLKTSVGAEGRGEKRKLGHRPRGMAQEKVNVKRDGQQFPISRERLWGMLAKKSES